MRRVDDVITPTINVYEYIGRTFQQYLDAEFNSIAVGVLGASFVSSFTSSALRVEGPFASCECLGVAFRGPVPAAGKGIVLADTCNYRSFGPFD